MTHQLRIVTIVNGKELSGPEAERVRIEASYGLKAGVMIAESSRMRRTVDRLSYAPDRLSTAKAMLAVEQRLVKAFWTIAKQPMPRLSPSEDNRNGISYIHDRLDTHARYTDAPGGKYETIAPRPSIPGPDEIDAASNALDWLLLVDERYRKILVVGATSKRGDAGRNISWNRLRIHLKEFGDLPTRTLQDRYRQALREIVTELTLSRIVKAA
jgi:hypothetical protein